MKLSRLREVALRNARNYPLYGIEELQGLRRAARFNAQLMDELRPHARPGITTEELNEIAHEYTVKHGHTPACLGYKGYPKSICTSINDVVCHGIPGAIPLREGDIVNIDVTTVVDGWYGDQSETFLIGNVSETARAVTQVAFDSLYVGIRAAKPYGTVYDIARAITHFAEGRGYGVVRNYQGHGIGREFHQQPGIPHYPHASTKKSVLLPGCCFTIEPMINVGGADTFVEQDGWTVRTKDGSLSAQFEHQIFMTEQGPEILTLTEHGPQEGHLFQTCGI
ncbi:MAG: type I methionyl aminopeptidase [Planctomycetaceae bacterium]|nr:type I methionyl aminopeptidase [Planctomycetaceae bacterium]